MNESGTWIVFFFEGEKNSKTFKNYYVIPAESPPLINCYSNVKTLDAKSNKDIIISSDQTYAKGQFGAKENETKILGLNYGKIKRYISCRDTTSNWKNSKENNTLKTNLNLRYTWIYFNCNCDRKDDLVRYMRVWSVVGCWIARVD